jgi:DNA-binding MarR family transcriptional regulator
MRYGMGAEVSRWLRYRGGVDGDRDQLVRLLQEYAGEAERLSQVFADRHDMHVTDFYALLAVMQADRAGHPLTPGRLGAHLGLSSGATTAVIDRLERADHVRRTRDDRDRRRITLRYGEGAERVGTAFFGPLGVRMDSMLDGYDAAEMAAARRFLADANAMMRAYRAEVTGTALE